MSIIAVFGCFLLASLLAHKMEKQRTAFKSDEDLMFRYMVYTHRKYRKDRGLKRLY